MFLLLRVCFSGELPPRARRIRHIPHSPHMTSGTTSACAENTNHTTKPIERIRNYLRVRGEYQI